MLDINFVRANLDLVRQKLEQRGVPRDALDRFNELDERRRTLVRERDDLNAIRNRESQEIGKLMKAGQKEEAQSRRAAVRELGNQIAATETELNAIETDLNELMVWLPNLPHESVPVGPDESSNHELKRWGTAPAFDFEPRDHVDLGVSLGLVDLERAAKISGSRFAILTGAGARLERGLINFC